MNPYEILSQKVCEIFKAYLLEDDEFYTLKFIRSECKKIKTSIYTNDYRDIDLFYLWDALGIYTDRDQYLECFYQLITHMLRLQNILDTENDERIISLKRKVVK